MQRWPLLPLTNESDQHLGLDQSSLIVIYSKCVNSSQICGLSRPYVFFSLSQHVISWNYLHSRAFYPTARIKIPIFLWINWKFAPGNTYQIKLKINHMWFFIHIYETLFFYFSETNERVNFWNILFDINQKLLDEEFLKKESESVNCSIETVDTQFSDVFNTEKKVIIVKFCFNVL